MTIETEFGPDFGPDAVKHFEQLTRWRRDVRHFKKDPVPDSLIKACLDLANFSPSVGLSQPWRFVELASPQRRQTIIDSFQACNEKALASYEGEKKKLYATLKLEGLHNAPVQLAVFCDEGTKKGSGLGKATMPEMLRYSVVTAIYTFWLAARTHGLGVGWVSIIDPEQVKTACDAPDSWSLVGYLCVGWPQLPDNATPELERKGWEDRTKPDGFYKKL